MGKYAKPRFKFSDGRNPQDFTRYSYVYNNPLKYTDPGGEVAYGYANIFDEVQQELIGNGVEWNYQEFQHILQLRSDQWQATIGGEHGYNPVKFHEAVADAMDGGDEKEKPKKDASKVQGGGDDGRVVEGLNGINGAVGVVSSDSAMTVAESAKAVKAFKGISGVSKIGAGAGIFGLAITGGVATYEYQHGMANTHTFTDVGVAVVGTIAATVAVTVGAPITAAIIEVRQKMCS